MTAPNLVQAVEVLASALDEARVDYAIGGAVALAFWTGPRATLDIDVTVDVDPLAMPQFLQLLRGLGAEVDDQKALEAAARGDFGARLFGVRLDIFLPTLPLVGEALLRKRRVPFGLGTIDVMSAEDVLLLKVLFGRTKDFADIERLVSARTLDNGYIEHWLSEMFAAGDARVARYRAIIAGSQA